MFKRFMLMIKKYGYLAGYLLVKCETLSLTSDDVITAIAKTSQNPYKMSENSCLVQIIAGNLEQEPDVTYLAMEGLNGICFDLNLDKERYFKELGLLDEED